MTTHHEPSPCPDAAPAAQTISGNARQLKEASDVGRGKSRQATPLAWGSGIDASAPRRANPQT